MIKSTSHATIVPVDAFSLDIVTGINRACFDPHWDRAAIAALLALPGSMGWVALVDGEPRGYVLARMAGGEAEILSIGVLPESRRQGIGRSLLAAAIARLGAQPIFLEVSEDNSAALALYSGPGFLPVGRRRGYYRTAAGAKDAVVLRRRGMGNTSELPLK
jgi:ribosomal-protein-alanine N-acetyltransferase